MNRIENRDADTRKKSREQNRDDKEQRGECRECSRPAAIKRNGRRAKLCPDHLKADRKRKSS